ncbi:MAG TPA: AraC family transcriptional regulator [Candidatus Sulfotelmatobacter sp.]|nr:AraC family transcriptional regulator [Candidatus Sulfotelmatobacter sp.]
MSGGTPTSSMGVLTSKRKARIARSKDKPQSGRDYLVLDSQVNADGVHIWPFDPRFPIDVVHHHLSGLQPFRMNRHDYLEILFLNAGELVWQIQDQFVTQSKGDLFVMGSAKYHRVTEKSSSQAAVESLFFHPDLIRSSSVCRDDSEYLAAFQSFDPGFPHVIPASTGVPAEIRGLIARIHQELPASSDRAKLCVKTYLKMILVVLLNHYSSSRMIPARFDRRQRALERFKPLFEFLDSHYWDQITPIDAAKTVNMSRSHFRRAFKQVTGQSFVLYLNHFRIAKAQELLVSTDKSIAEVGMEVGFCDQSYFGLIFRRCTQMTPLFYRNRAHQISQIDRSTIAQPMISKTDKTGSVTTRIS